MPNIKYELNEKIHAIIINPYLTWEDFCVNCDLIKKYNIKNISTSLNYLDEKKPFEQLQRKHKRAHFLPFSRFASYVY